MKRFLVPVAEFFCSMEARPVRVGRARRGAAQRLCLVVVAVAVFASSLVLAGSSSAHDVFPVYSCDSGEPDGDNECVDTVEATAVYSCAVGKLAGDECEIPTGADAAAVCPTGRLAGDVCVHAVDPAVSCGAGKLVGNRCVESVAPAQRCPTGRLAGDVCVHAADPVYSCGAGMLKGNRCVESVAPAQRCPAGRLAGDVCVHAADPVYSCGAGMLKGNRCVESVAPAQRCPAGRLAGDVCVHAADPVYSCGAGTLVGNRCVESVAPAQRCPAGRLAGDVCVHAADPVYSCGAGMLSGARCLHTASPVYSCASGTLSGTRCVSTHAPVCTLNNDFAPCDTPGVTYHCSAGFTVSGGQCTRSTAAAASCPAGYQRGNFGICYKYTAASSDCPAGYPPPAAGLCLKRTPAAAPCQTGFTLTGGQCTRSTLAGSDCPAGYPPPAAGLCLKRTPAAAPCQTGFTLTGGQCTRSTLAVSRCPVDYDPPAQGVCYKRTPPEYTCTPGTPDENRKCVTTEPATLTHACPEGAPDENNQCTTTTPAALTCNPGTPVNAKCPHNHTGPAIEGLDTAGSEEVGRTYQDPFSVLGTNRAAAVAGPGCSLAEDTALRAGTTRHYTLSATAAEAGKVACTITAGTVRQTATIDFIAIDGLAATGSEEVGRTYQDPFSVLGTNRAAAVAGPGCSLAEDTALRVGTTRHYTLWATAAEAGKVTCTITAGTVRQTATIDFTPPTPTTSMPEPTGGELAAPGGLGCTWHTQGNERVECTWHAVAGATAGYAVEYELTLNLRGTTRKYASQKTTTRTEFSGGMNKYVAKARYRVAAKGPNGTGPYTAWATAIRPALAAPTGVSAVCGSDGVLSVSWGHRGPLVPLGLQFDVEVDGSAVGAVSYRSVPGSVESYAYRWEGAHSNRAHRVRVRVAPSPAGAVLGEERRSAWSSPVTANTCAVFKPDGFTAASCTAHGVVHLEWDPVGGADRYDLDYPDDGLANPDPDTDPIDYEGPATEVYAQRWEGETYEFRIRARARTGQEWSGWTDPVTVRCDPLSFVLLTANRAVGVSPHWESPNGSWVNLSPGRKWVAPQVLRYMPDDTKDLKLGRDNCTETKRNAGGGWTRTCTIYWTEPLALSLDEATAQKLSHPAHIDHSLTEHLHMDADGDPTTAPHRHCKTTAGTCPGPDDPNAPDLAWHSPLPPLDDNFWTEQILIGGSSAAISGGASIAAAALAGATTGQVFGVGVVVGLVVGAAAAWLWRSNVDPKLYLVMNASTGCLDLSLGGGPKWESRGSDAAEVEYTLEEGGYETKVVHEIAHCVKVGSTG